MVTERANGKLLHKYKHCLHNRKDDQYLHKQYIYDQYEYNIGYREDHIGCL